MSVAQADNSVIQIRKRIRRLTSSPNESSLPTADIDQYINSFYTQDFIYAIKLDQLRSVHKIFTTPNIDVYPLDVNANQGIRSPVYIDGIKAGLFKDRGQFFNVWPLFPPRFTQNDVVAVGDGVTQVFNFTITPVPFLPNFVKITSIDTAGLAIAVEDDGDGNLVNAENTSVTAGTVNYETGVTVLDYTAMGVTPGDGKSIKVNTSRLSEGRPRDILFWNDEITVRPVPNDVFEVQFETYLTPTQFEFVTDKPILNQWKDYIACGSSLKILEDRGDVEGYQYVFEIFQRQEGLVLERQGIEEIGQRNQTIYTSTVEGYNNSGFNSGLF